MNADDLLRTLVALETGDLRARKAAALLCEAPADEAVAAVSAVLVLADQRSDPAAAALEGILRAVRTHLPDAELVRLHNAAEAAQLLEVQTLFTRAEARRSFDRDRQQWVDKEMQARSLGQRRQLARSPDRDLLARLAADQDTTVVRQVLENPRCTEREALVAASRRPARTEVLEEVFRSRRWSANRRVRRALALNPYSPPALAAAALALLTAPDLREVANDGTLSAEVRVQARRLLGNRTPDDPPAAG